MHLFISCQFSIICVILHPHVSVVPCICFTTHSYSSFTLLMHYVLTRSDMIYAGTNLFVRSVWKNMQIIELMLVLLLLTPGPGSAGTAQPFLQSDYCVASSLLQAFLQTRWCTSPPRDQMQSASHTLYLLKEMEHVYQFMNQFSLNKYK